MRVAVKKLDHASRVAEVARVSDELEPAPLAAGDGLFMDWGGAKSLLAAGHEVGSHTVSHAILERETEAGQLTELADSRRELESGLGISVDTLAFPNGAAADYSATTTRLVSELGYRCAVTTRAGLGGPLGLALRDAAGGPHADHRPAERGVQGVAQGPDDGRPAGLVVVPPLTVPPPWPRPPAPRLPATPRRQAERRRLRPVAGRPPSSTPDQTRAATSGRHVTRAGGSAAATRSGVQDVAGAGRPGRSGPGSGRMPSTWRPAER